MCVCIRVRAFTFSQDLWAEGLFGLPPGPTLGSHTRKSCRQVSSSIASNLMEKACEKPTGWWFQPVWKILVQIGSFPQVEAKITSFFLKPPDSSILVFVKIQEPQVEWLVLGGSDGLQICTKFLSIPAMTAAPTPAAPKGNPPLPEAERLTHQSDDNVPTTHSGVVV